MKSIFLAGRDAEIASLVEVLKAVNAECRQFYYAQTLLEESLAKPPDLFIIAFELSGKSDSAVLLVRKEPRLRNVPVLVCYPAIVSSPETRIRGIEANDVVLFPVTPETLLSKTAALLQVEKRRTFKTLATVEEKNGHSYAGMTDDFSPAGLSFTSEGSIDEGNEVMIYLFLPGLNERIMLTGLVTRKKQLEDGKHFYGVRFINLEKSVIEKLKTFIDKGR